MTGFFPRGLAALAAVLALITVVAASAATAEHRKVGDESLELRDSLASFLGPRSAPATAVDPRAFAAAATTADSVPSIDGTPWGELGPYSYFPDDHNYIDPAFSNSGSGSGFNSGRITGVAVAPNGDVYAAGAGGGIWRSTDAAHQAWTPVFDDQQTTAEGAVAVVGSGSAYTVYAGTGEPTINLDSYAGVGILASSDHGATWRRVGGDELVGAAIFKIVPAPGGVLYAATSHGLYRLASGASTWQKVIGDPDTNQGTPNAQVLNLVSDVAVRPGTNGREVVAVRGWRAGAATNGLYVSTDFGQTFRGPLQPQGYLPQNAQGRGSLAYSADGKKLYVMVESPLALEAGVFPEAGTGVGVAQIHGCVCEPSNTGPPIAWLVMVRDERGRPWPWPFESATNSFDPCTSPVSSPRRTLPVASARNVAVTSRPLSSRVTCLSCSLAGRVTSTKASPPLIRSARLERVLISN